MDQRPDMRQEAHPSTCSPDEDFEKACARASKMVEAFPTRRRVLLGMLDYCKEPRTADELRAYVETMQEGDASVFGADVLCARLEEAGALDRIASEPEQPQTVVDDKGATYLVPANPQPARWRTSPAGQNVLNADNPAARFRAELGDGRYADVFLTLLTMCDADGGSSAAEMSRAVDDDPLLAEPRLYAPHFFNILARCGCIAWADGAWRTTDLGKRELEELAV